MSDVKLWLSKYAGEIIIGAFFLVIGVILDRVLRDRKTKTLDWELLADEPIIVGAASDVGSGLTVRWNGQDVDKPRIVSLRVVNSGKKDVVAADYVKPVTVEVLASGQPGRLAIGCVDPAGELTYGRCKIASDTGDAGRFVRTISH